MMTCSLAVQRPDLKIVAIEPVPDNVECLHRNVTENGIANVEIIHAAASDKPGTVKVNINGPWSAVLEHGEVSVPAVSLDQFADRNVSYIKIDAEGWEPYVLAGGHTILPLLRPLVFMEWNSWSLTLLCPRSLEIVRSHRNVFVGKAARRAKVRCRHHWRQHHQTRQRQRHSHAAA